MIRHPADDLQKLSADHPIPDHDSLVRHRGRLERILVFYHLKVPKAPPKQANMFNEFVMALGEAIGFMNAYRDLTERVDELAKHKEKKS